MLIRLMSGEFMKIKRKGFWIFVFLGPIGVVALQMVNYGVRKDYLLQQSDDNWMYYIVNVNAFTSLALVLGIVILTSLMASVEDETRAWKQLLALPVTKKSVYISKFSVLAVLLVVSSTLLFVFTFAYGSVLELGTDIPVRALLEYSYFPLLAALPVLALHLWITTVSKKQGVAVSVGIIGTLLTYMAYILPDWMIWKWPSLMNEANEPLMNVYLGLGVGIVIYLVGMLDFMRRDVK
ncbi:ABC transporter permease [Alkalihalobacterium bogoriense]|uniref:ABC transporter permease n=1 Tax=Alkalihalobacterium bogoriense TaxID=246272 RepID=UPI00047BDD93|nr:ABC transporter permease [Alkalihalobacterium bogoriense]